MTPAPQAARPRAGLWEQAAELLPWLLAGLTIVAQISWVRADGPSRDTLTVAAVCLFFLTSLAHSLGTRGWRWTALVFGWTVCFGLALEALGTATGFPFGEYAYSGRLGPALFGVPLVIPLAWAMMTYPCFVIALRTTRTRAGAIVLAAALLASWDVFLDPQMVGEGYWTFTDPALPLPGAPGTPLRNYLAWLAAALLLMALLSQLLERAFGPGAGSPGPAPAQRWAEPGRKPPADPSRGMPSIALPAVLLGWVYVSNVLANLVFLGRPLVALSGGVLMGIPLALVVVGSRRRSDPATVAPAPGPADRHRRPRSGTGNPRERR